MAFQKEIYKFKFIITVMAACAVSLLAVMISTCDLGTTSAVALGSFISTLAAFRWFWRPGYGWENYLVSVRPMFQTVSYVYLILGPLPAVAGVPRFLVFPGAIDYYWCLYLLAPCAFIFYELGYERSLGKIRALHPGSLQTFGDNSNLIIFALYILILAFFIHFSTKYGIEESGISSQMTQQESLTIKATFYLYDGLLGTCLFAITAKWLNCDPKKKIFYLIMGLTLFGILVLSSSRTKAVTIGVMCFAAVQLNSNKLSKNMRYLLIIPMLFLLTTAIRQEVFRGSQNYQDTGMSVARRLEIIHRGLQDPGLEAGLEGRLGIDFAYRMNGIEWAGGMLHSHEALGVPFMWGENFFWGAYQAVPKVWLPFPKKVAEGLTDINFKFTPGDPNGSIFASMIADAGPLGIIIGYFALGFFNGTLWRYSASKKTPQYAKLAYLAMIPGLIRYQDTLGTYIFINIRNGILCAIIFWIIMTLEKFFLAPTLNQHYLGIKRR